MRLVRVMNRLCLLALGLALVGCFGGSGEDLPKVYPVQGTVTLDGKAVEEAIVTFNPNEKGARTAAGRTDAQGVYKLTTFNQNDGCAKGRMTVTISKIESPTEPDPKTGKIPPIRSHLPVRFSELNNSGLEAVVEAKPDNTFDFKLESR
ncbi:hypothetical protein GC163_01095 [bacterium]|nr:hypothetical protein [bacterium]